jgi:hypothetical protein
MGANFVGKEKEAMSVIPGNLPDPAVKTADTPPGSLNMPAHGLEVMHALRYRQLQEEHEAREKKLLAEVEEKQEMMFKKLEASFAEKERRLIEDLQAKYMAEYRRLELAAADREHTLAVKLGVARRRLGMVIIGAVLAIVAILNFRSVPRDAAKPAVPLAGSAGEATAPDVVAALLPHLAVPEVAKTEPVFKSAQEAGPNSAVALKKAGNGGNFVRGYSSGK